MTGLICWVVGLYVWFDDTCMLLGELFCLQFVGFIWLGLKFRVANAYLVG